MHARLGHGYVSKLCNIPGFEFASNDKIELLCEACELAKFHRYPFADGISSAFTASELVHMGLWGPYKILKIGKKRYLLTISNNHTKITWVYLLQNKVQVPNCEKNFVAYIKTQF